MGTEGSTATCSLSLLGISLMSRNVDECHANGHSLVPEGPHMIGDGGPPDVDGHSHATGCIDDATNAVGYWSLMGLTEVVTVIYFVAVERVATGAYDVTKG